MNGQFDRVSNAAEKSALAQNKIDIFTSSEGMLQRTMTIDGVKIKIVTDPENEVDANTLQQYARAKKVVAQHITNNCFQIADSAIDMGVVTGSVSTDTGTSTFARLGNHCVGFDISAEGQCLSVDLTASVNIDRNMGNFDVLVVGAKNQHKLLERLGSLYGGQWKKER